MTLNFAAAAGVALLIGGAFANAPAHAQVRQTASFDCRRAANPTERAICTSPRLSALDRQIGVRYASLRRALDPASANALIADQRAFLATRNATSDRDAIPTLADTLRDRLAFLTAIAPTRAGVVGTWRNVSGMLEVARTRSGGLRYRLNAVDPVAARWTCDTSGSLTANGPLRWAGGVSDSPGQAIAIRRQRNSLSVAEPAGDRGYCGLNGGIGGTYFPVTR